MLKRKKDDGFTLIELMIVIAVIGILAVVLIPKVGTIKTQAKTAGIDTNIRMVQGFVESRISTWANDPTTYNTLKIQTEISDALVGSNASDPITNPLGGPTALDTTSTSALQTGGAKGEIYVYVPATLSNGVVISGAGLDGTPFRSVTVKP